MRGVRLLVALLTLGLALLMGLVLLRYLGALGTVHAARPQPVPRGDREIAWFHAATNSATWERFVAGVQHLRAVWPELVVEVERAFPEQTAGVPEVVLGLAGQAQRLRVRWYKLTSEMGLGQWVRALAERDPPPLAIIGGGSSDRARDVALALRDQQAWRGAAPLLFITTATADRVMIGESPLPVKLTDLYEGRTFRCCYQNSQMAEAVTDFVWSQPDLRPHAEPAGAANRAARWGAVVLGAGCNPLRLVAALSACPPLLPAPVFAVGWLDDPYSSDLRDRFQTALGAPARGPTMITSYNIPFSVGDYNEPNRYEAEAVKLLAKDISQSPRPRRLLVLPTGAQPARRVLRKLTVATPAAVRNVVAVTGDSINFNNIYRDRDVAWNVQEMPVALVFFCHQDPVSDTVQDWRDADPARGYASATDDVLLNADLMRLILESAEENADADEMSRHLRDRRPAFFGPDGNRLGGQGEFVVCLRPQLKGEEVLPAATVEVWRRDGDTAGDLRWRPHRSFQLRYDVPAREEARIHVGQ